ncbi:MAG: hypothetical protein A3G91_00390 [Omnitrophica WOR_2 bacterium RIFCSPLOWO2_12_FULL_50_9]|nr:MAG: hypothetical protein A3D87_02440 [Omnitrophica WOR_2 bacterium RIFCSPHIGHO2_02_FULL_50_17]OGX40572.1 MAG: hypothetical protein A3G91_00390 [Omnitrophica WOR_2 bacterium RIFCSPLOWO2_12_FULL_50_9]
MIERSPKQFNEEKNRLVSFLIKERMRLSQGRETVFAVIMRTHGHFTAEDIVKACRGKASKVSRATVYRSLQELLEAGIVRVTAFGEKHNHFEHTYDERLHHHAQCVRCHGFIEFPDLDEDERYRPLLEKEGFKVLGHEMHFYGICKKCRKKG